MGELLSWFFGGLTNKYKKLIRDPDAGLTHSDRTLCVLVTFFQYAAIAGLMMIVIGLLLI